MKKFLSKTKRNSHRNSSGIHVQKLFVWLIIAVVLLFAARTLVGVFSSAITTPFFSIRHYIETSTHTIPVFLRGRNELRDEIRLLEEELLSREGIHNSLTKLTEENEALKELLGTGESERIVAGVIGRPPYTPYDVVILDKGSADGVVSNAPVYYGDNKALGYVHRAFEHSALVTLISSPGVETSVYVFGPDVFATAVGQGGGVVRISIPQGLSVEEGNLVITPSLEGGVLGDIERVESNPTEPDQYAYLTYDAPIQAVRLVSVGTQPLISIGFDEAYENVHEYENEFLRFEFPTETPEQEDENGTSTEEVITEPTL